MDLIIMQHVVDSLGTFLDSCGLHRSEKLNCGIFSYSCGYLYF